MYKTEYLSQSLISSIDKTYQHSANKTGIPSDFELDHLITNAQHIKKEFLQESVKCPICCSDTQQILLDENGTQKMLMCLNPYCWYPFLKTTNFNEIIQTDCFKSRINGELGDTDDQPKSPQASNNSTAATLFNTTPLPQSSNSSSPRVPDIIPDKNTSEPTTSTLPPITDVYARENSTFCCITETQKNLNFSFINHLPSELAEQYDNTSLISSLTAITYLPKLYQHRFSNEVVSSIFNLKSQLVNNILQKPVKRARKNEKDDYRLNFKDFEDYLIENGDSCIGMVVKLVSAVIPSRLLISYLCGREKIDYLYKNWARSAKFLRFLPFFDQKW